MGKKSDYRYVRITATIANGYRNRGLGFNVSEMADVTAMFENLEDADLSKVVAIRVKPTEVYIRSAKDIASQIENSGKGTW